MRPRKLSLERSISLIRFHLPNRRLKGQQSAQELPLARARCENNFPTHGSPILSNGAENPGRRRHGDGTHVESVAQADARYISNLAGEATVQLSKRVG
jgi:hypothetical protein